MDPTRCLGQQKCIAFIMPHLPTSKATVARLVCIWLRRFPHWDGYKYASFHVSHPGLHTEWCADCNSDWNVLQKIASHL